MTEDDKQFFKIDEDDTEEFEWVPPYVDIDKEPNMNWGPNQPMVLSKEDQDKIARLREIGCTIEEIVYIMGGRPSKLTLYKQFKELLEYGESIGNARLRRMQYKKALEGNVQLLIWLGKQRLGQTELPQTNDAPLPWTDNE